MVIVVIRRSGLVAYDEKFHSGVNVIRGENSSGKSTILNFIFYGLGGDLVDWSETAQLIEQIDALQKKKDSVNAQITSLRSASNLLRTAQNQRLTEA